MTYEAWSLRHEVAEGPSPALEMLPHGADLAGALAALGHPPEAGEAARLEAWALRRVREGASLFHQGAAAAAIYLVHAGTFKCVRTATDGYEQVLDFLGRGDILGFDAVHDHIHPTGAVALEDARVHVIPWHAFLAWGPMLPALARVLQTAVSRQLASRADMADTMAAVSADVRLARFLLQMSQRQARAGQSRLRFVLRMSRRDIASHLGVAHETVSRSFTELAQEGYLRVRNRDVQILDLEGLRRRSRSTRGPVADAPPQVARFGRHLATA